MKGCSKKAKEVKAKTGRVGMGRLFFLGLCRTRKVAKDYIFIDLREITFL